MRTTFTTALVSAAVSLVCSTFSVVLELEIAAVESDASQIAMSRFTGADADPPPRLRPWEL